jgi:hypothetical protein
VVLWNIFVVVAVAVVVVIVIAIVCWTNKFGGVLIDMFERRATPPYFRFFFSEHNRNKYKHTLTKR